MFDLILHCATQNCSGCFKVHTPHRSLCRKFMKKRLNFSELSEKLSKTGSEELLIEINEAEERDASIENLRSSKEVLKDMSLSESSSEENEVSMLRQPSNATILGILDGHSKRSSEEFRKPISDPNNLKTKEKLGTIDTPDECLFHALPLFRGFSSFWYKNGHPSLCQYSKNNFCVSCCLRSFAFQVNEIKMKSRKSMKPAEIHAIVYTGKWRQCIFMH